MKKLLILFELAVLLICVGLSGCFDSQSLSSEEQRFVGSWIMEGMANDFIDCDQ
jgi:hypothetical protein